MHGRVGEFDTVALEVGQGRWLPGTTGTVVELLDAEHVLVEFSGPDGATQDLLPVATRELTVVTRHGCDLAG